MTRHTAYAVHTDGTAYRHPFATFPHADAARVWLLSHPDMRVRFVPALPEDEDAEITWHGAYATVAGAGVGSWIVTLPNGHPEHGYAPGSQFLATDAELREAGAS